MSEDAKTTYSDAELEAMMADVESEFAERKESLKGGMGITVARTALRRNNQPDPSFQVQSNWVHCTIGARP